MRVKICGLRSRADAAAAARSGAVYGGFVFFSRSPRHLTLADALWISGDLPERLIKVALAVDPEDSEIEAMLEKMPIDMLQLHGRESPERVVALRAQFGLPVMKAVGIADESDLAALDEYGEAADQILVDARPPRGAERPGGHGLAFDWRLIQGRRWRVPWMLAGGLTPENVAEAVRLTGARQVDVSSGVESARAIKDPKRMAAFVAAASAGAAQEA